MQDWNFKALSTVSNQTSSGSTSPRCSLLDFSLAEKKLHQTNASFFLRKLCCHLTVSLQLIPRISQTCAGNLASRPKRGKNYVGRFLSKFPSDRESREELIESERFRNFFETVFFGGKGMNFFGCFANRDGATIYYFLSKRQKSHFVGQKKSLH